MRNSVNRPNVGTFYDIIGKGHICPKTDGGLEGGSRLHWECQQESGLCEAAPDASPAMISLCPQTCPLPPLPRLGFLSCEEQVVLLCEVVSRVKRTKVCVESIVCYKKGSFDGDPLPSSLQFRNGLSKLCSVFKTQVRHQCGGGLLRAALAFCMLTLLHAGCGLSLTGSSWGTGAEGHPTPSSATTALAGSVW